MEEKNMKHLHTLYVQVDNTSANKCYTVIIGLAYQESGMSHIYVATP